MKISPLGYRVRVELNSNSYESRHRVGVTGQWNEYKNLVTKKLQAAILSGDAKRQKQMYKCIVIFIDNQKYSNFLVSSSRIEYVNNIPSFESAIELYKKNIMKVA